MVSRRSVVHLFLFQTLHQVLPWVHVLYPVHSVPVNGFPRFLIIRRVLLHRHLREQRVQFRLLLMVVNVRLFQLLLCLFVVTAQVGLFEALLERVAAVTALLVVHAVVQVRVVVLLVLSVRVLALRREPQHSLRQHQLLHGGGQFAQLGHGRVERGQDHGLRGGVLEQRGIGPGVQVVLREHRLFHPFPYALAQVLPLDHVFLLLGEHVHLLDGVLQPRVVQHLRTGQPLLRVHLQQRLDQVRGQGRQVRLLGQVVLAGQDQVVQLVHRGRFEGHCAY